MRLGGPLRACIALANARALAMGRVYDPPMQKPPRKQGQPTKVGTQNEAIARELLLERAFYTTKLSGFRAKSFQIDRKISKIVFKTGKMNPL